MPTQRLLTAALRHAPDPGPADRDLLASFAATRDEAAFAELVRRHARLVLAACHRVTGHAQDAEDAFQAAFLVLARRAGQLRRPDQLSNWLYGVAVRTALDARKARRRIREEPLAADPAATRYSPDPDLAADVDEDLARLPEKFRAAVVPSELEGVSRRDAAARLRVPEGTLSSRLAHARKLLAARLARRGVTAGALSLATPAAMPAGLIDHTARIAARAAGGAVPPGLVSDRVSSLTAGALKAMLVSKLRLAAGAVALVVAALGAAVVVAQQPVREGRNPPPDLKAPQPGPLVAPSAQARPAEKVAAKGIEDEDVPYPTTPAPAVVRYEDGKIVVRQRVRGVRTVANGDNPTTVVRQVGSPVVGRKLDASDVLVFDMKGNRLVAKAWREKLQSDQHVLVAWGGTVPNPRELTLFKDDTLVGVFPAGGSVVEAGGPGGRTEYRLVVQPDGSHAYVPFTAPYPVPGNYTPTAPAPVEPVRIPAPSIRRIPAPASEDLPPPGPDSSS